MAASRVISKSVRALPLGQRIKWAREHAGLSHDRLVERMGRSDRSYLIRIEKGKHTPRQALLDAIADACDVPRDLFDSDDSEGRSVSPLSRDEYEMLGALMSRLGSSIVRDELGAGRA